MVARILGLMVLLAGMAQTQFRGLAPDLGPVEIHSGFQTGNGFREMNEIRQRAYVAGLVDGMLIAPVFGAPKGNLARLETCVTRMSDQQVAAILNLFLKEHPERWHEMAQVSLYAALSERCP